ncbi:protoporphyrinogen oxidase [Tsukamurella sp. 8F]|uniref:protoporphyrinogen oxidase n=1 Tax=unclassified Tsukamurella TaxID=2633480 RepID=UPI0023BA0C37|nr:MULTISPECIES: protoporphyrinogen oxidase [unclassified Tsukamurella]MDF0531316.1 protoporphyrinogen oxidase [Tsukamurella sp. 8J]MDF0585265.1 protoporphyrinogen oxidase [Tsukamurella sp. 8F]
MTTVAVIGGGISGLVAAYRLSRAGCRVTVFEGSDRVGGKLRSATLGSRTVDVGAEAFLRRRPEVMDLAAELGLADQVVSPVGRRPLVYAGGTLRPFEPRSVMGIPGFGREVDAPLAWRRDEDVSLGGFVRSRLGDEVVARSVDPMVSGVYAAHADDVSLRAAVPAVAARLDAGAPSLTAAVTDVLSAGTGAGPVFGAFRGGYQVLLDALVRRLRGSVVLGAPVGELRPGWMLRGWLFDEVVLAVPPSQAARLTRSHAPELARLLAGVPAADSAMVSLAFGDDVDFPDASGVLVASGEVLTAKAFTLSTQKWGAGVRPGNVVRVSMGRLGVSRAVELPDDELVAIARADLAAAVGVDATPVAATVQRWYQGIPVYTPGHLQRVAEIEAATPQGLTLVGAYFDGVGVPACVARADRAVARLLQRRVAG